MKLTDDPTPMQVQMRLYEDDINTTIIEDISRNKEVTAHSKLLFTP